MYSGPPASIFFKYSCVDFSGVNFTWNLPSPISYLIVILFYFSFVHNWLWKSEVDNLTFVLYRLNSDNSSTQIWSNSNRQTNFTLSGSAVFGQYYYLTLSGSAFTIYSNILYAASMLSVIIVFSSTHFLMEEILGVGELPSSSDSVSDTKSPIVRWNPSSGPLSLSIYRTLLLRTYRAMVRLLQHLQCLGARTNQRHKRDNDKTLFLHSLHRTNCRYCRFCRNK